MAHVHVEPVETRRQRTQFVHLPWELYADYPCWMPPLLGTQRELLGYKHHPFHDDADMQTFLATRDGRPVGRIAAIVHHAHLRRYNEQRGYFGFFECVDDVDVSSRLFDAATQWLRSQGMQSVRGPMNPSFNYEMGLLIDGFDRTPMFMMTYNPPYYPKLVEHYGFQKTQDMYSYWGDLASLEKIEADKNAQFVVREATRRFGLTIRTMNRKKFDEEIRTFLNIYNLAFQGHWGFVPLSESEVVHISAELRHLIVPELTAVAEAEGKTIGCVFGLPDYNPRIKKIQGRLFPTGFMRLLWNRRAITSMRIIAAHVVPEYQRWGIAIVLLSSMIPHALKWGIQDAEFSWIMESNHLSVKSAERGGAIRTKSYRLYDLDLN